MNFVTVYKIFLKSNYGGLNAIMNDVLGGGEEVYSRIYKKVNGEL